MSEPKAVFLSYASQDAEPAKRVCEALRAAGIEVWFDQSELRGGDAWDATIRKQIKSCSLFIPIISRNTHNRGEGYFRLEWKLAVDRSHLIAANLPFLVPVVVDATDDTDDRVPDRFREVQWTRLPAGSTPPAFVQRVSILLSPDAAVVARAETSTAAFPGVQSQGHSARPTLTEPTTNLPAPSRSRLALILSIAAIIVVVAYVAFDRFMHSKRVVEDGRSAAVAVSTGQRPITEKTIAVLPFVDLSEKKDQEYFADGMAAELIDLLAKIPGVKVIGRTSSFQFKGGSQDLPTIGSALGAAYIVEGSVRKSGDRIRVTVQLIDSRDGSQRWSSNYDKQFSDVLAVQDAIAVNLARALQLTVSSDFQSRATASNTEAYDEYLRGVHSLDHGSQEGAEQACAEFQQSLDLDPSFVPAALGLANAYQARGAEGWLLPTSIPFERARQAADLAIRLDPKLGAPHALLAQIHMVYDWDWTGAEREIRQAQSLRGGPAANEAAAQLAAVRGEWDQATELFQKALAVDPLDGNLYTLSGWSVDLRSGRYAHAELSMRRALEINPNWGSGYWFLGLSLLFQNRLDEALAAFKQERPADGLFEGSALVYHAMGKRAEADAALKQAIAQNGGSWASAIARVYAFRGERDRAFQWLERAYLAKDEDLFLIKHDPLVKNLEGDPRYKAFLRKMNLPE